LLQRLGVERTDADLTAKCLVDTEVAGVATHGLRLLPAYIRRIELGALEAKPQIRIERTGASFVLMDGGNGLGPAIGARAMDEAIRTSQRCGVAVVCVRNSNHLGACRWYVTRAARAGCIGIATSNGSPAMAPWNGTTAIFGANPIAFGIPAANEPAIIFDMATSVVARAKIRSEATASRPIPDNWALDADGRPTTDPMAALAGALLPVAGPKGYGLALILEALAGALSGAGFSHENRDLYADTTGPQNLGHFLLAIDPRVAGMASFYNRVDELVRSVRSVPSRDPDVRVRTPGDLDAERRRVAMAEGVALNASLEEQLDELATKYGVPFPQRLSDESEELCN
jgi:LDH2 family malate/lactate/ureidoglycolate dehydrogenase